MQQEGRAVVTLKIGCLPTCWCAQMRYLHKISHFQAIWSFLMISLCHASPSQRLLLHQRAAPDCSSRCCCPPAATPDTLMPRPPPILALSHCPFTALNMIFCAERSFGDKKSENLMLQPLHRHSEVLAWGLTFFQHYSALRKKKKKSDDGFISLNFSGCEGSKISLMFLFIDCSQDETIGSLSKFITSLWNKPHI